MTMQMARGSRTRTANMNKRRQSILKCAGEIIASEGIGALTMGRLAQGAGVTIPTVHNLFGKKHDIYEHLVLEMIQKVEQALSTLEVSDPISAAETFVDKMHEVFREDETLYKAAFIAGENTKIFDQKLPGGIFQTSLNVCRDICETALEKGDLLGRINSELLAFHIFSSQRLARQDWVNGYITLPEYRRQVLQGIFITFLSDTTDSYKDKLHEKLSTLV